MYRVIDGNDTGKTRKLLTECGESNLFVCEHANRVADKCYAYDIPIPNNINYQDFIALLKAGIKVTDGSIYIDELEKFVKLLIPQLEGYTLTKE